MPEVIVAIRSWIWNRLCGLPKHHVAGCYLINSLGEIFAVHALM